MFAAAVAAENGRIKERKVERPRDKEEERKMKEGHEEDNNEELAYFNVPLLYWSITCTVFAVICMVIAISGSLYTDFLPSAKQLRRGFVSRYGTSVYLCNSTITLPVNGLPSVLHLFDLNVVGNIFFRCAVVLPMALRIFQAYCMRNVVMTENYGVWSTTSRFMTDLMPILMFMETMSMSLFSIVTTHFDYNEFNRWCKFIFVVSATVNIIVTSMVTFVYLIRSNNRWDTVSLITKLSTGGTFVYLAPQYLQYHQAAITFPVCHSLVPRVFAFMEYACFISYFLFHLSQLIDIRNVNFMCYPRTCSGECEPLDPRNFEKGGRYEHCRSWEYRHRQKMGWPVLSL